MQDVFIFLEAFYLMQCLNALSYFDLKMQTHHLFSYAAKLAIILSFCCITEKLIVTLQFWIAHFRCKLFLVFRSHINHFILACDK